MTTEVRTIHDFLGHFQGVEPHGQDQWKSLCPGHDDHKPSLSIRLEGDKIKVKCFTGCEGAAILKAVGLELKHLYLDHGKQREITATYDYVDEEGKKLYRKVRWEPKSFTQESAIGLDAWDGWKGGPGCMKGVRRVLYRLPEVLAADTVIWCEGEKDAENVKAKLGLTATTVTDGAGSLKAANWPPSYAKAVKGRAVVLVPDRDRVGIGHALFIASKLKGVATSVKVLMMPEGYKDISDWLVEHGKAEWESDLLPTARDYSDELVAELTAVWGEPVKMTEAPGGDGRKPQAPGAYAFDTDLANAERLVKLYGADLRYCYDRKLWLSWDGKVWESDLGAIINQKAKAAARHIYVEAANELDDKRRSDLAAHAKRTESDSRIRAMISRAQSELPIAISELDTDPWLLNCQNGIIDLRTGKLLPHDKSKYMTKIVPTDYDPGAECPKWTAFMQWATAGDAGLLTYLQRAFGYALTGDYSEQCVFFVYGLGRNGKSTMLMTIRTLLGDYGGKMEADELMIKDRKSSGPKEAVASLIGKRFVLGSEVRDNRRLDVGVLKDLSGGESMAADRKYEHLVEFIPIAKLWLYGNKKPMIRDRSLAVWRRVKLVRFDQTVPEADKDKNLRADIEAAELPGILAWAVRGCLDWQREGLAEPGTVTGATEEYRADEDVLAEWIDERCCEEFGGLALKPDLRASYEEWCNANKVDPLRAREFKSNLIERGIRDYKGTAGKRYWKGIRLLEAKEIEARAKEADEIATIPAAKAGKQAEMGQNHEQSGRSGKTDIVIPEVLLHENYKEKKLAIDTRVATFATNATDATTADEGDISDLADDPDFKYVCGNCKGTRYWLRHDNTKLCAMCRPAVGGAVVIDSV